MAGPPAGALADDGLHYVGAGYTYGGTARGPGDWDCSSFVSYCLGHDLKLGLPGGRWGGPGMPPNAHGPVVESYASWAGAVTVQSPARGDLVCFVGVGENGHIGIVLGPDQMVSALDSSQGTLTTPIQGYGPPGAPIVYRRVLGIPAGVSGPVGAATGGPTPSATGAAAEAVLLVAAMVAAVVAAAALVGAGAVILGTWLAAGAAGKQ